MRRLGSSIGAVVPATLAASKRHARRRQIQQGTGDADKMATDHSSSWRNSGVEDTLPNVSSLRSEGMMSAPATTSLDTIRSQLAKMRAENKKVTEGAAFESQRWLESQTSNHVQEAMLAKEKQSVATGSQNENLTALIRQEYSRINKPNDVFKDGKEVFNGVVQRSFLLQQKRFLDTDEVLRRPGNGEDTRRFVKLAFASSSEQTAQLVELLQRMRAQCSSEKDKLSSLANYSSEENSTETLSRVAWIQVLEQLSDDEVRLLWEASILDAETLEALFSGVSEQGMTAERALSEDVVDGAANATPASSLLDEKIDYIQRLHYLQELTRSICETELGNVPSIDLAPILVKAQRRQFADITAEELRKLEQYGESAAMRIPAFEGDLQSSPKEDSVPRSTPQNKVSIPVDVPASILDRAFAPSNSFLSAVAEKDAALKKSLEGMERIKRETLLDPVFQEAVRFAHAIEEASVAPHIHGVATDLGCSAQTDEKGPIDNESTSRSATRRFVSKRERRAARSRQFRGPMARSPYAPELVPYFYNDMRSIVPPRGVFNLPDPTPSKAERAEERGRRRRARQHSRFQK
ncbi:hypothetical protein ABL78_6559 [Leptomonas seymouri]|uniref:Uncharacterized protein n=1 Tax=Leptomonas seymouri TaxID=5684 RepID=A0A0N1I0N1_LEPSE|nr:hypothetical protein ABL78_6559 [Leptomonas seymouri]|eukprot:KPI84378.1 hypothetical protein ABL78_6559 [Leptomonas seymouri]